MDVLEVPTSTPGFDVFVSYRHQDDAESNGAVRRLVAALRQQGLSVWFDDSDIRYLGVITEEIRRAITTSTVFVAYYAPGYLRSGPCNQELTQACLAADARGELQSRVLALAPGGDHEDIHPVLLRDTARPPFSQPP